MRYFLLLVFTISLASCKGYERKYRNGDLIFQETAGEQSKAVGLATHSPWSHMGMIVYVNEQPYVLEAIGPVLYTPLQQFIARGVGGKYVIKRLAGADTLLNDKITKRMKHSMKAYMKKPYDFYFEWSDKRIYCSELVWKLYKDAADIELGRIQQLREFDLTHPDVQKIMNERYGTKVPLDEPVISPVSIFNDERLMMVEEG